MVHLRNSWHLSLSVAPIPGNPTRLLQPETVSHARGATEEVLTRSKRRDRMVLSGLAPPPLADAGSVGYRAASHEGGGRGCGTWNADRRPSRSARSALPSVTAGSAA